MTDAETLARLRASEMDPGEFLDALERIDGLTDDVCTELARVRRARDLWRFTALCSWVMWTLTLLAVWGNA